MAIIEKIKDILKGEIGEDFEAKKVVSIKDSDKVLNKKIQLRIDEAEQIRKPKLPKWQDSLKFFDGDHWQVAQVSIPTYKADIVINKVFSTFRSLVAFETDNKPSPVLVPIMNPKTPDETKELLIKQAEMVESRLDDIWDDRFIPTVMTEIYYDRYIYDDGYGMYFWNTEDDDVDFEAIKPTELLRSPGAISIENAEYIIVEKKRSRKFLSDKYKKELIDKIKFVKTQDETKPGEVSATPVEKSERENLAVVYYYFEDDIRIVKSGDVILEKIRNPFWEWRSPKTQTEEMQKRFGDKIPQGWKPVKNHLKKPEKPIVHFKGYHLSCEFESRSLMKQLMPLNMAINKRKCQIQDIIDGTGNPQKIIDPSVPETEVRKITSQPGLKIRVHPDKYRTEPPSAPPAATFDDMLHSEQKFDDTAGHHDISRGAVPSKRMTKAETQMLRQTDVTPVRLLMRNSEVAMTKLLNGWVQLMKLFYDQPHYISKLNQLSAERVGEYLSRDDIPDNLSVQIKVGSTMPVAKELQRNEYKADFAAGALDLLTYLELMDYPNPKKIYDRIVETQKAAAEAAAAEAAAKGGTAAAQ